MSRLTQNQKKDLLKLADHVETNVAPEKLAMGSWGYSCGTVGCLAFHATQLFPGRLEAKLPATPLAYETAEIFNRQTGTTNAGAFADAFGSGTGILCFSSFYYEHFGTRHPMTPKQVAAGIRKFVERS